MLRVIGQASGATAQPPAGKLASHDVAVAGCESLTCYFGVRCIRGGGLRKDLHDHVASMVTPRRNGKKRMRLQVRPPRLEFFTPAKNSS